MGEDTRRVVAGFEDPRAADEARARLEAEHGRVEENAPVDSEVAYEAIGDRGDSTERQPATTVAVEVTGDEVEDGAVALRDEGAEKLDVVEPPARS